VGAVGSQQANKIQNELNLGNISLDNVYDTIINFAASPAVSALRDTPSGTFSAPELEEIEKEQERMRELNKQITLPSEIPIGQILSTPQTTTVPEPLITPDVPKEKVSVDDIGFTAADPVKLEDMITTIQKPSDKAQKDFFETSYEYDTYDGRIEDMEYRYHGGVGDLGDNQATKSIQKIDGYDDYAMYLKEQAENFLGPEFNAFRITNTKEVMQLLNNQNKNKIKSFTLNPKQAIKFGYFANEAFMDPITTQPRGDLLIIESPVKSSSLVMRGRPEEAEVVSNTARTSIKQSRIYNPYTGEVVYEPTEGPLVGTQPHQFENLIRTESEISSFINDLAEKSGITLTNEKTIGTRQEDGQTTIEALKAQSEQTQRGDVDRGSQSDQGEYVLKTEEGFEIAPLEQSSDFFTRTMLGEIGTPKSTYQPIVDLSELGQTFNIFEEKRSGNFENHIFTSIPTFKEAQVATADALIKSLPKNANILDIGGTEGGFINTIAEVRPDVTGFIVDPNVVAEKIFNQQKMPNSYYIREAFTTDKSKFGNYAFDVKDEKKQPISTDFFDANLIEDNSLDAITEKMTFQFIDKGRNNKVKLVSEKLKPTGIALFEEKFFTSYDDPEWKANEDKKNQFKLQYYDQKDLTKKQKETLEGMDKRQVTSPEFEKILSKYFNNVVQYWDSGNFKGYVASNSADTITNFLNNLENLSSDFSNVETPRYVTPKIDKKKRGGPISIPKIDML
jgi:hypothetical protein